MPTLDDCKKCRNRTCRCATCKDKSKHECQPCYRDEEPGCKTKNLEW